MFVCRSQWGRPIRRKTSWACDDDEDYEDPVAERQYRQQQQQQYRPAQPGMPRHAAPPRRRLIKATTAPVNKHGFLVMPLGHACALCATQVCAVMLRTLHVPQRVFD
jgi:hypothetical protein